MNLANLLEERREREREEEEKEGTFCISGGGRRKRERRRRRRRLSLSLPFLARVSFLLFFTFFLQPRVLFRGRNKEMGKLLTPFSLSLCGERTEKPAELRGKVTNTFMGRGRKPCCIIHVLPTHSHIERAKKSSTKIGNTPHFFPYITKEEDTSANNAPGDKNNKYFFPYFRLCSVREGKEGE